MNIDVNKIKDEVFNLKTNFDRKREAYLNMLLEEINSDILELVNEYKKYIGKFFAVKMKYSYGDEYKKFGKLLDVKVRSRLELGTNIVSVLVLQYRRPTDLYCCEYLIKVTDCVDDNREILFVDDPVMIDLLKAVK